MRILHINDKLSISGGVEVYIDQIVSQLMGRGIEADWLALSLCGQQVTIESRSGELDWVGPLKELFNSPLKAYANGDSVLHVHSLSEAKILEHLFQIAPVVRHMHEPRVFCPGQGKFWAKTETICAKPYGLHCLYHAYSKQCCNRHPKRLSKQFLNVRYELSRGMQGYRFLLANSQYMRSEAIVAGVPPEKIELIHYFTNYVLEPKHEEVWPDNLLFVGRLSLTKGVHYLLKAMRRVSDLLPSATLDILGSGHDEMAFKKMAADLGLGDRVKFHGWADRQVIDKFIGRAAIVAFPSIYPEAFGISGIEAMMRGKPVVGFDVGGVKDWLHDEETGVLVESKNVQAFADAIVRLLEHPDERSKMGTRAQEIALTEFSEEVHMKRLLEIYKECLVTKI